MENAVRALEEAIDYIDKMSALLNRIKPGDTVTPGFIYQLYELLTFTREKVVEARMKLAKVSTPTPV